MQNSLTVSEGGGQPMWFEHAGWSLGHPEVWLTFLMWAVLLVAVIKVARRLWRLQKPLWLLIFGSVVGAALACYIILSIQAFAMYSEGRGAELVVLPIAKHVTLILSCLSAVWIVADWRKARRSR